MTNQGQKTYQSDIGLNRLFLLVIINSLGNDNLNHYELLCKEEYSSLPLKSIGTALTNKIDNYNVYKLLKDHLVKISKLSKPEYGIYIYINNTIKIDDLYKNKAIDYVKSIENGKFYKNNLYIVNPKNFDPTDLFINFDKSHITDVTA